MRPVPHPLHIAATVFALVACTLGERPGVGSRSQQSSDAAPFGDASPQRVDDLSGWASGDAGALGTR